MICSQRKVNVIYNIRVSLLQPDIVYVISLTYTLHSENVHVNPEGGLLDLFLFFRSDNDRGVWQSKSENEPSMSLFKTIFILLKGA